MSDPSDRFAETFSCGCSWEQGQYFRCAQHQLADAPLAPEELPQQHIRNALAILAVTATDGDGRRMLTATEYGAIRRRMSQAVAQLEAP